MKLFQSKESKKADEKANEDAKWARIREEDHQFAANIKILSKNDLPFHGKLMCFYTPSALQDYECPVCWSECIDGTCDHTHQLKKVIQND